ncbi:hypothetical protein BVRB_9g207440 [Beta vulgaris subsp. vulgaris]|nr:hypothetical protein BVRB_9g207440 [Beta vulgaris subsp. vulgaris]
MVLLMAEGGNRNGPQNIRRGRGGATVARVPAQGITAAASTSVPPSPAILLRSSSSRHVTRGGVNRRRPRGQVPVDTSSNKRQALADPGSSAPTNEIVQVEDLNVDAPP